MEFAKQRLLLALALACLPATAFGQDPFYVESAPAVSPEPLSSWLEPGWQRVAAPVCVNCASWAPLRVATPGRGTRTST